VQLMHGAHLMHPSQSSSSDERTTFKWVEVAQTARNEITIARFLGAYSWRRCWGETMLHNAKTLLKYFVPQKTS